MDWIFFLKKYDDMQKNNMKTLNNKKKICKTIQVNPS